MVNKGIPSADIIQNLEINFNLTNDVATKVLSDFLNETQLESGFFENRVLKVRDNPGFLTEIKLEPFTSNMLFKMTNINNLEYLDTIQTYFEFIIRVTQNLYDDTFDKEVNSLCLKKKISIEQISFSEKIVPVEKTGEEIVFDDDDLNLVGDDALDIMFGEEGDDVEFGDDIVEMIGR